MADDHARCTYNDIHKMIAKAAERIQAEFKPDMIIAIGMQPPHLNWFTTTDPLLP
jgi:hypothetical protein